MITTLIAAALLASCATTRTKPPSVSGKDRVPVNGPAATKLLEVMAAPIPEEVIEDEPRTFTRQPDSDLFIELGRDGTVSREIHVQFLFAGNAFRPTPEQRYRMRRLSTVASRVDVRGRTDNVGPTHANRLLAMKRAMEAKMHLIEIGMPAERISIGYVAGGDHVGDERTKEGRAKNRRVEIEFFISPEA